MPVHPTPPCRYPQSDPVGRLVAGPTITLNIDKRLQQYRCITVPLLPVLPYPACNQRQGFAGQISNMHPGEN